MDSINETKNETKVKNAFTFSLFFLDVHLFSYHTGDVSGLVDDSIGFHSSDNSVNVM